MYISEFREYMLVEKHQSIHTIEAYISDLNQFAQFLDHEGISTSDNEIKSSAVRLWIANLMDQDLEVSSIHRKMASVSGYFRYANKRGWAEHNPVKGIKKPKLKKQLPEFLEQNQTNQLYVGAANENWEEYSAHFIAQFLYETGLRRSELIGLKYNDIDFIQGQMRVLGKRNKIRLVPLNIDLIQRIQEYQKMKISHFQGLNAGALSMEFLFVGQRGEQLTPGQLYNIVRRVLGAVTTKKKRSPHILRHTFATQMLNEGADLNVIKEILGHSSLAATQVYTHVSISKLKQLHEKLHPRND